MDVMYYPLVILLAVIAGCLVVLTAIQVVPAWPTLKQAFVGVDVDPRVVGLVRGIVLYILPLVVGAAVVWVQGWTHPALVPIAGLVVGFIRLAEAALIDRLKPAQNAINPPPVAGGGGPELARP